MGRTSSVACLRLLEISSAFNRLGLTVPPSVRTRADEVIEYGDAMSAYGTKRTFHCRRAMSACGG
jgi:hypothetical protein